VRFYAFSAGEGSRVAHQAQGTTSMVRRVHSRPHSGQSGGSGLLPGHPLRMTAGRAAQWRQPGPGALVAASMRSMRRAGSITVGVLSSDGLQGHRYYLDSSLGGAVTGCHLGPRSLRACLDRGPASEPGRQMRGGLSVGVSASDHLPPIASERHAGQYSRVLRRERPSSTLDLPISDLRTPLLPSPRITPGIWLCPEPGHNANGKRDTRKPPRRLPLSLGW
jgi:hypothetical protein